MQRSVGLRQIGLERLIAGLAIVLLISLVGGCSHADSSRAPTSGTSATSQGPASTQPASQAAVLAAYRAYWDDVIAAGKTADWQSPQLDDHSTGQALQTVRDYYRGLRADGLVARGTVSLHARVLSLRAATATIQDCNDTSKFLRYDAKTGALRDTSDPVPDDIRITLELIQGAWMVTQTAERGKCRS
jgi:hypothetical protein